jgi:pimeloyl-ACP methyl ester carboxylesterase
VLTGAEHVRMRGVGHVPMWDAPDEVARLLLRGSAPVSAHHVPVEWRVSS